MAAQTKDELKAATENEFNKLFKLLDGLDAGLTQLKDAEGISIQDVVGHRAHWMALFLNWYRDGMAGKKVYFPAEGYKWNDLKRYNAALRQSQSSMDWHEAMALLSANAKLLTKFIDSHSNQQLYGAPMRGANNAWTPGRWAEAAGASHFKSATKYIRGRLRTTA